MLNRWRQHSLALFAACGDTGRRSPDPLPSIWLALLDAGYIQYAGRVVHPTPEADMYTITPKGVAYLATIEVAS